MKNLEFVVCPNITFSQFKNFILLTERDFVPPLCSRVNVLEYYEKLHSCAQIIACIDGDSIVGLAAFYCNDTENQTAYVTFIAVLSAYRGKKIASNLLILASEISRAKGMRKMMIDTNNEVACQCYLHNGFRITKKQWLQDYNLNRFFLEKEL